ncbi:helix-turn-helix domain-containing protein [Nocardia elegans]|uniref:Helix-turn-helix domain-containing protein n=1 Tax=Nocardia elegans TaxID=300029 RepID=A0ABW6TLA5_9NOCA
MNEPRTVVDAYRATPRGGVEYAAAELTADIERLLREMRKWSDRSIEDIAALLNVDVGRVQDILSSHGNIRMSTLAKYAHAHGYRITISAEALNTEIPHITEEQPRTRPVER